MEFDKELPYLWAEYEYRHDLIWRVVLRLAVVVASLSYFPYANESLTVSLGWGVIVPPILAVVLTGFGFLVVRNELQLFSIIKTTYRSLQKQFLKKALKKQTDVNANHLLNDCIQVSWFTSFVYAFLAIMLLLSTLNVIFVAAVWIETAKSNAAETTESLHSLGSLSIERLPMPGFCCPWQGPEAAMVHS